MVKCRSVTLDDRVAEVLRWFDGDAKDFPHFGAVYFNEPHKLGHEVGPLHSRVSSIAFIYINSSSSLILFSLSHDHEVWSQDREQERKVRQVAQLSQRDRAAGWVSNGQKWKTGTGRQYLRTI